MMIIEGIARLRSSEIVFYTPQYFEDVSDFLNMIGRGREEYVPTSNSSPVRDKVYFRRHFTQTSGGVVADSDYDRWTVNKDTDFIRTGGQTKLIFPNKFTELDNITGSTVNAGYVYYDLLEAGRILLYGQRPVEYTHTATVVEASRIVSNLANISVTRSDDGREFYLCEKNGEESDYTDTVIKPGWVLSDPPIPPERGWASPTKMEDISGIRSRYLAEGHASSPKYISFERNGDVLKSRSVRNNAVNDKIATELEIGESAAVFDTSTSIYFVNGLCCMPSKVSAPFWDRSLEQCVKLEYGATYLRNQKDRKRGLVIVDFLSVDPGIRIKYVPLRSLISLDNPTERMTNTRKFRLPEDPEFIPSKSSALLVLNGRLFLPGEFVFTPSGELLFDDRMYLDVYEYDAKICQNAFYAKTSSIKENGNPVDFNEVYGYRIAATRTVVLEKVYDWTRVPATFTRDNGYVNCFVILINKPGLQVLKHHSHSAKDAQQFVKRETMFSQNQIMFSGIANGLVFDKATRSVVDYVHRDNDMTFYTPDRTKALSWSSRLVFVNNCTGFDVPTDHRFVYRNGTRSSKTSFVSDLESVKSSNSMTNEKPAAVPLRYAVMHDDVRIKHPLRTVKPDYCMLDFVFKG